MKPKKPNIIERLAAKTASQAGPSLQVTDVQNVMYAARLGLAQLRGGDLVNVAASLANLEAAFAPKATPAAQPATPAAADKPAEAKPA